MTLIILAIPPPIGRKRKGRRLYLRLLRCQVGERGVGNKYLEKRKKEKGERKKDPSFFFLWVGEKKHSPYHPWSRQAKRKGSPKEGRKKEKKEGKREKTACDVMFLQEEEKREGDPFQLSEKKEIRRKRTKKKEKRRKEGFPLIVWNLFCGEYQREEGEREKRERLEVFPGGEEKGESRRIFGKKTRTKRPGKKLMPWLPIEKEGGEGLFILPREEVTRRREERKRRKDLNCV